MPFIERHIRIDAPRERVWAALVDVPAQPHWQHDLVSVELVGDGPLRKGSRAIGTVQMFGLRQRDPIQITDFEPPARYGIAHLGAFRGWGRFDLRPLDDGRATHVRWREELRGSSAALPFDRRISALPVIGKPWRRVGDALFDAVDPLFWPVFAWVFRADLRRLKRLVETGTDGGRNRDLTAGVV